MTYTFSIERTDRRERNGNMQKIESDEQELNREMTKILFLQREETLSHLPLNREYAFFNAIKKGKHDEVLRLMEPLTSESLGVLSEDPVRNIRYHLIITIALTTRFCIEAGLLEEYACTLSDVYIRRADKCTKTEELQKLHREVILTFTGAMAKQKKEQVVSLPVLKTYDYIETHLHERLRLEDVAAAAGVSRTYLCGLFKRETGMTVGSYIVSCKISAARDLLVYTDYSVQDISNYLAFSSASHFISVFRSAEGIGPGEYRKRNYRKHFR